MSCIALKDRQRLSLTDAGEQCEIHFSQIIFYINSSCKLDIFCSQGLHQIITFLSVFHILVCRSHDPEFQIFDPFFCKIKCLYHGLYVFNRGYTENSSRIDKLLLFFILSRKICQCFCVDTIGCYFDFFFRAAKLDLKLPCMIIQTGDSVRFLIGQKRHLLKLLDPDIFIYAPDPGSLDQLLLTLSGVNTMLRYQKRASMKMFRHTSQDPGITGSYTVIKIRFRHIHL